MTGSTLLIVLLAACEFVGVGLVGAVVLRLLRRFPVAVPFAAVIVITVIAMTAGTAMLTSGLPEHLAGEPVVIVSMGVAGISAGLLLCVPVMRDGQQLLRGRLEVQGLAEVVDELFAPTRVQAGGDALHRTSVALGELVGDAVQGVEAVAAEGGVRVWAGWVEPEVISADRAEIARAIDNLLVNAMRCAGGGGTVSVDAWGGERCTTVSVCVEPGGGSGQRSGVDVPDHRGAGLRLAIVQGIAREHGGELSVREVPGGCRFEIRLPAAVP
ncbi:HAMP domain-containing sensor histidine kinase [Saccharopolyspora hirsuta]|uniref:HAMP domain-containing histidine kinase n=1 Tax=Saccharopolyspora hirsuta TaxID=1837 RepID=A0A5M7BKC3_SACHI|nr:HAMP domain-containing sensor histidine kinase [Saccharopolyspora hirsuta]KAA5830109.1 HAMP domain-containing histidine kinase [Saccharopolyspora hirsuta]MBF6507440.1 HAMP domain-containing histidine kinase [Nocardia farcinica]